MAGAAMSIDYVAEMFHNLGTEAGDSGKHLGKLADALTKFNAPIFKSIEAITGLGGDFGKIGDALTGGFSKRIAATTENFGKTFGAMTQKVTGKIGALGNAFGTLSRVVSAFANVATGFTSALGKLSGSLSASLSGILKQFELIPGKILPAINQMFASAAGPLGGALVGTITAALSPLRSLEGFLAPFMNAINPGIMEQLNLAFNDLNAVVGRALTPIMGALIPVVRTFADAMVPVAAAMKPVFEQVAAAMISVSSTAIPLLAGGLISVAPMFEKLAATVAGVVSRFSGTVFKMVDAIIPTIGKFMDAIGQFVTNSAPFVAKIGDLAAELVQGFAPILSSVIPGILSVAEAFMNLGVSVGGIFVNLAKALTPLVEILVPALLSGLSALVEAITWVVNKVQGIASKASSGVAAARDWLVDKGMEGVNGMMRVFGKGPIFDTSAPVGGPAQGDGEKKPGVGGPQLPNALFQGIAPLLQNLKMPKIDFGASMGASAKPAGFVGMSELGSNLQAAAFGAGLTPEMKTAENTAAMLEKLDQIIGQGAKQVANQMGFKGNQLAAGVRNGA